MWPLSTETEPKRFSMASACSLSDVPHPHVGINRPQRNMREDHDGRAALEAVQILLQPVELRLAEFAHALELHHVDQADEVHAFVVEAVPAVSLGAFAVAIADTSFRRRPRCRVRPARRRPV